MKKKIFVAFIAVGIAVVNLCLGVSNPTESEDLTLQNIEVVGLSASESKCDASNMNPCSIQGIGTGTGQLIHVD